MVRQADQRHPFGKPELPSENFWRPRHLVEPAAVEAGGLRGAQQFQALRHFLQHRAGDGAGQGRVIPAGEPGVDIADIAAHAAQRRHHGVDRMARIFCRVLVAGKALFLVVDDQARPVRLRHLDQRHARIVGAGRPQPGQIHGLAALQFFADMRDALVGKFRAELMKARSREQPRAEPARSAETGGAEPWMSRTNSLVRRAQRAVPRAGDWNVAWSHQS